ncbi:MAG TPA: hypothetical protein VLM89_13375 [Phycisphaerae bacterium]|nr:hypothetical protein [Phycisphaerae bacterium]
MIEHIVLIGQGPNDIGFLEGLRDRLGCHAQITDYRNLTILRQRGSLTRPKDARQIIQQCFSRQPVDLVIRLTDGDSQQPQAVAQKERRRFPDRVDSLFICGVCDRDIEAWLALDVPYLAKTLGFNPADLPEDREAKSAFIKNRIKKSLGPAQTYTTFIADYVKNAPPRTLKQWLANPAFSAFYDDCRTAANSHNCEITNLRDAGGGGGLSDS